MRQTFIVINTDVPPDEPEEYWSNEFGWTNNHSYATRFSWIETKQFRLPINGEWKKERELL